MSSSQQPPPSNPFDGFDNYQSVVQQPISQPQLQNLGSLPVPPNQWVQQPTRPVSLQPPDQQQQKQQQALPNYNPFETINPPSVSSQLLVSPGGVMQPPSSSPDMITAMAMQQQQLVPMAPNTSVPSPWAVHPTVGQQQIIPTAPNSNVQSPWGLQPVVGQQQQLVPMPSNAIVQSPWAVQVVSIYVKCYRFMKLFFCRLQHRMRKSG